MEKGILALVLVILTPRNTDGFEWSPLQRSSHVINSYLGSNANLPCQFTLSAQEEQLSQQFHAILWSRETSFNSKQWELLTSTTQISGLNSSLPQILLNNKKKFSLKNNSLTIFSVGLTDDTQYQCEVKSSFYTSPSTIKVNVVYKPYDTKIVAPSENVKQKSTTIINCTAKANPKPGFSFYHNDRLIQNSSSEYIVINTTLSHHKGKYMCIPWNNYGDGPNVTITLNVQDIKIPEETQMLSDEIIAGITGAVALVIVVIIVAAIMCLRFKSGKQESESNAKTNKRDVSGSHLGPAMYGSDASIATSTTKTSVKELRGPDGVPAIYGSDINDKDLRSESLKIEPVSTSDPTMFYGAQTDFSMANLTYTPREQKFFKLERSTSRIPADSNT